MILHESVTHWGSKKGFERFKTNCWLEHEIDYDYSKVVYKGCKTKITIICPEHGEFEQIPDSHTRGCGCPKCGAEAISKCLSHTKGMWVAKAKEYHGDKYDYSETKYERSEGKLTIICPEHGEFRQRARNHLHGDGCPKCGGNHRHTTEDWIGLACEVHGDKYDYTKVTYRGAKTKVIIICPEHGEFEQEGGSHTQGCGCPKCATANAKILQKHTQGEVINRFKEVHGGKYDYSKVVYKGDNLDVTIICPEHGAFRQKAGGHKGGSGCSKCARRYQPTTDEWVEKAKEVHGDKYDYSNVVYKRNESKVTIICPEHGEFKQTPAGHTVGKGCRKCGINRTGVAKILTIDEWVEKAKEVHGDKYDYNNVVYKRGHSKVIIICPEHGEFEQTPTAHAAGRGCRNCGIEAATKATTKTTEQFIEKAKEVHGDKYDYSKVVYKNTDDKVTIICPEHGEFEQTPNGHTNKKGGCRKCANVHQPTTDEWVEKAKEVHGDKYDYSKVVYKRGRSKVIIICPEHGPFWQIPNNHLHGKGCPKCGKYGFQPQLPAQLYLYNIEDRWLGFGITGDAKTRHTTHSCTLKDVEHELIHTFEFEEGANALEIETLLKQKFVTVDTGYDGFRTEAISINYLPAVLNIIEEHEEL